MSSDSNLQPERRYCWFYKVVARKVFSLSAFILLIAGLIPKFSALLRTIPQCVLGGAVASVFAGIAMTGIKLLVSEGMSTRNTTVADIYCNRYGCILK